MSSEQQTPSVGFLPGEARNLVFSNGFRKLHTLDVTNGYKLVKVNLPAHKDAKVSAEELVEALKMPPKLLYGNKINYLNDKATSFIPAHVAYDKMCLRFGAYFKQTVHESTEQYHLRRVNIFYYLEDDSIAVVEPPVENSGIPQGVLIKRHRIPKNSSEYYTTKDFNNGLNITFYGKTFRIVNCDKFTREYMEHNEKIKINAEEPMPADPFVEHRFKPHQIAHQGPKLDDTLRKFLENDRKVLRYYCIWDDRDSMFGELREFVIHYYLVDDTCEVREVQKPNNGRDPFPILLKKQALPKTFKQSTDLTQGDQETHKWWEFNIGSTINVLGRSFLIYDMDGYTRRHYEKFLDLTAEQLKPLQTANFEARQSSWKPEYPPYNGYGSVEDSLGSCKYLVLKPPKKDFIKMLENEHKVLRFVAKLESRYPEDQSRRFVISYRLADDMMTIYEPPQRNAGIIGGKFMERTKVLQPDSQLTDPEGPRYYTLKDVYVGAKLQILKRKFVLIDADDYAFNYMEQNAAHFPYSSAAGVLRKLQAVFAQNAGAQSALKAALAEQDHGTGDVHHSVFVKVLSGFVPKESFVEQELVTIARFFDEEKSGFVKYQKIFA